MCEDVGLGGRRAPRATKDKETHLPKKIRVYELAKELGLTNKEGLELALSLGIGVKSHSSSIEDAQADRVRRKAEREGLRRDVQPEEPPKPAKRTTKKAAAAPAAPAAEPAEPAAAEPAAAPVEVAPEPAPVAPAAEVTAPAAEAPAVEPP